MPGKTQYKRKMVLNGKKAKYSVKAKCPTCGDIHVLPIDNPWTGKNLPRKYCTICQARVETLSYMLESTN